MCFRRKFLRKVSVHLTFLRSITHFPNQTPANPQHLKLKPNCGVQKFSELITVMKQAYCKDVYIKPECSIIAVCVLIKTRVYFTSTKKKKRNKEKRQ